ncbi:MAG TPA: 3-hydroxyacyl-CoA dehydrogenase NAD-binding domain-containing protein [Egibacteraceae bacterium]|jgi:3-hydroxyacyl-CoA dehydrogenase/enoyl-CoA hydratase/carnithine racemase|nr:3-hydroxyacyl-CoA dehydrogenase NAD-binding domain-containing protein [Egibacteraceae bacterium]
MADSPVTQFKLTHYDSRRAGRLALLTMDNGQDHRKPTTFGPLALESLSRALDTLEGEGDVKGLLLTGKPFVFAAGADLKSFHGADETFARGAAEAGHAAFQRLQNLPFPTLAAINGACLGGGLEIALHCDYRTLSTGAGAIAFPEVFLSIFPAWGGTQLAPRIIGAENALTVIVHNALSNNKLLRPKEAFALGLADRLFDAVDFLDRSVALLERLVTGEETITRAEPPAGDLDEALAAAREAADNRVRGATRAPYVAIDLIAFAARGGDLDEGRRKEIDALAELLPARQAQAAVYSFELTQQRVKRQPWRPDVAPRRVRKVGIVGSGLMGAQLGSLFLQRLEVPLVMKDIDQGVLDRARLHIEGELDKRVERGRLGQGKARFLKEIVTYTLDDEPLGGSDFVLEAVLERMDLKQRVFADVERVVDEGAVLATNTSSLSVTEMGSRLAHPERLVGFHFFNPVAVLPFLEIVRTERTNDGTLSTAFEVSKGLRKSGVLCADTPAFIVNRLLTRFNGACIDALRRGNDFAEIDDAVKALGLPMGPFELLGFVGVKVAFHTAETLHAAYPDRFPINENFRRLAALDVDGIYDWSKGRVPHEAVTAAVTTEPGAERLTAEQIRSQAIEAVADEANIMLDEGVVADARDIDTGLLLGAGWPFFMGGVCKYLDETGLSEKLFGQRLVAEEDRAFV